jgi:2-polyprenyl-6-hydroxyphenyl methylase/3-demethylubiquinone-9 3-methyltransferase
MAKILVRDDTVPRSPSIDPAEIEKFRRMASEWWSPTGKFAPLHRFNPVRIGWIRERLLAHFGRDGAQRQPFAGLRLLDAGCGGGLISEPMARLGCEVLGVDAGEANIKAARIHAESSGVAIDYRVGTVEGLIAAGEPLFDVVLALEVVEHVADPAEFLRDCAALVAPGGLIVVATLNRTARAFALAVVGAEYVLRWLPQGTHDWKKFVTPEEATAALAGAGLAVDPPTGVSFSPLTRLWSISRDTGVNYMMSATRPIPPKSPP